MAEQYKLVIISPILERDTNHGDLMWNTAVILSERGQILGKQRKNHIPSNGESEYYIHGSSRCQVFDTIYGKIGVTICFDRHHPLNWMMYAINGAEIVFNPAATVIDFNLMNILISKIIGQFNRQTNYIFITNFFSNSSMQTSIGGRLRQGVPLLITTSIQ